MNNNYTSILSVLLSPVFLAGIVFLPVSVFFVCLSDCLVPKYIKSQSRYFNFVLHQESFVVGKELVNFWSRPDSKWPTDSRICWKPIFAHKLVLNWLQVLCVGTYLTVFATFTIWPKIVRIKKYILNILQSCKCELQKIWMKGRELDAKRHSVCLRPCANNSWPLSLMTIHQVAFEISSPQVFMHYLIWHWPLTLWPSIVSGRLSFPVVLVGEP